MHETLQGLALGLLATGICPVNTCGSLLDFRAYMYEEASRDKTAHNAGSLLEAWQVKINK